MLALMFAGLRLITGPNAGKWLLLRRGPSEGCGISTVDVADKNKGTMMCATQDKRLLLNHRQCIVGGGQYPVCRGVGRWNWKTDRKT